MYGILESGIAHLEEILVKLIFFLKTKIIIHSKSYDVNRLSEIIRKG